MRETLRKIVNKKYFHMCMILVIIVVILFVLGVIALKYNVEGETNMPFNLSKITIISTAEGDQETKDTETKWNLNVNQHNDIYFFIENNKS